MKRFRNILCVVDPAEPDDVAFARAVELCNHNFGRLKVVAAIEETFDDDIILLRGTASGNFQSAIRQLYEERLEELVEPHRDTLEIETELLIGTPFLTVIQDVVRNNRDLVIKVSNSWDWDDRLLGSNSMQILRKCPCPVWLVKAGSRGLPERILAAVDVGDKASFAGNRKDVDTSREILDLALSVASYATADLHLVHAWHPQVDYLLRGRLLGASEADTERYVQAVQQRHEQAVADLLDRFEADLEPAERSGRSFQSHVVRGKPAQVVPRLASDLEADLLIMGTVGRTGIPGLVIGNTAESILGQVSCSVLAIKPQGFESPVATDD